MSANPFWEFSLEVYARPGVAEACIALQDEAALDVNLILFCLWSAMQGPGLLEPGDVQRLGKLAASWQDEVVKPLRGARRAARRIKTSGGAGLYAAAFQRDIAATELSAERVEQWLLFDGVGEHEQTARGEPEALRLACANLAAYLKAAGADAAAARPHLEIMLGACFPSAGGEELCRELSKQLEVARR
jgi:uncharacterized protein (TIGR02444 family)